MIDDDISKHVWRKGHSIHEVSCAKLAQRVGMTMHENCSNLAQGRGPPARGGWCNEAGSSIHTELSVCAIGVATDNAPMW